MSYIDWARSPQWEKPIPPPRASALVIFLAGTAAVVPFAMLGAIAGFAHEAGARAAAGTEFLGP